MNSERESRSGSDPKSCLDSGVTPAAAAPPPTTSCSQQAVPSSAETEMLRSLRAFFFPGGEASARGVQGVRTSERGEMRAAPAARWTKFTADEFVDATRSAFRWRARIGTITVVDAYEAGRGRLEVKLGGLVPLKKLTGPELDRGELQRYLGSVVFCPFMLLNHPTLAWNAAAHGTLRLRDSVGPVDATVDLEFDNEGHPRGCRAERYRLVSDRSVLTPWSATFAETREYDGVRLFTHLEVNWELPEGTFTYFRGDLTAVELLR